MFRQEINLHRAFQDPEPLPSFLTWHRMMLCNFLFIFILICTLIYTYLDHLYLDKKKSDLQLQSDKLQNEFTVIKNKYPAVFFSQNVSDSIAKLSQEMQSREKILRKITNQNIFSEDMEALTRIIIPEVWLTEIIITNSGDTVQLKGRSRSVEKMQRFLIRLTSDKTFANFALSVKNIQDNSETAQKGDLVFDITMVKNT